MDKMTELGPAVTDCQRTITDFCT